MPFWWNKKPETRPYGPGFNHRTIQYDDTAGENPRQVHLPAGAFYQLIAITYKTSWSLTPSNSTSRLFIVRANKTIYYLETPIITQGIRFLTWAVNNYNPTFVNTVSYHPLILPEYLYLESTDTIQITESGTGSNFTVEDLALTVKEWPYDH